MAKVIVGGTMSLDGYISDPSGSVAALYSDFEAMHDTETMRESQQATGAVVMGRKTFEMAGDTDTYADTYEYQVPIFVLTRTPPARRPKENGRLTFTFVTDGIESAIRQARVAAGDKEVQVIAGASTAQQVLRAGLADELHMDVMPVLLGGGLRLFDELPPIQLERLAVFPQPTGRTQLRFRVVK
jgi:dihydrofolate reductase